MRLAVAVNAVGLAPGGGLTYLVNQARIFEQREGLRVTYFVAPRCVAALRSVVPHNQVVLPFEQPPSYRQRFWWEQRSLPRLLASGRFDVLYAPASFAVFGSPIPQVIVDHNPWHFATKDELGSWAAWSRALVQRRLAKASAIRAEAVVYLTDSFVRRMAGVGFPPPSDVIASGVSADWVANEGDEYGLRCPRCRGGFALAVHNWYPHKRLGWLAETWSNLAACTQLHLIIVGSAVDRGGRRRRTEATSSAMERVHFVENLSRDHVASLYRRASLFVSASVLEAFPLTPLEAMTFGVPCVLSDIPQHREVSSLAAKYFPVNDPAGFAQAVRQAGLERDLLIEQGHRRVASFSWEDNVSRFVDVFVRVAAKSTLRKDTG